MSIEALRQQWAEFDGAGAYVLQQEGEAFAVALGDQMSNAAARMANANGIAPAARGGRNV